MEYRYTREILKSAVHQIEVIANTADAWISMKARQYRILISLRKCSDRKEEHAEYIDDARLWQLGQLAQYLTGHQMESARLRF